MKQIIHPKSIPVVVLLSSMVAVLLRMWTWGSGPDASGLFAPKPLAWALLWVLTGFVVFATWFALRGLKKSGSYQENYPKSLLAGICMVPAAVMILITGVSQLRTSVGAEVPGTAVDTVTGIFGLVAGLCLLLSVAHRCMGKQPFFAINGLICLYLAVRLFDCCQLWSNEPQVGLVVFPFLASTTLMLAVYHRVCFDVDLGKRQWAAFWSLLSVYFCVIAIFSNIEPLFYGMCALWRMADLCSLRPLKRKKQPEVDAREPEVDG